ncbi:MAG: alpha/beta hydrolase, partial [Leptospiraceae bacterium]|nr:alpha/beta hydrolase [Leptospiraceae bacterium]
MLFITNRFPRQGIKTEIGRKFDFDLEMNGASNSIFFCESHGDYNTEIGGIAFMNNLKESKYRQVLFYIHGFANLPDEILMAAREFQDLCNKKKQNEILVIPIIWPCDNDFGIVKDYWDDQQAADQSKFSFVRLLEKFREWRSSDSHNPDSDPCMKRINILAHSMGNRVLRETMSHWSHEFLPKGVPMLFRNIFMVAADVVNETLEEKKPYGNPICDAARNVVVYFASDDLALRASKAANLKNKVASRRLGHTGPENLDLTPKNVYSVDCDDINQTYDPPIGHSYFRSGRVKGEPGLVFEHIFSVLESGR